MSRILAYLAHGFLPMEALCQGAQAASGLALVRRANFIYGFNDYERCSVCLVFGAKDPVNRVIQDQRNHNTPVLVADLGYIKRGDITAARAHPDQVYWSVNLNGLNGWGDPPRSPMPADRWQALNIEAKPWRTSGDHILVCSQKPNDAAIDGIDPIVWLRETIGLLRTITKRPIRWRVHPEDRANRRLSFDGATQSTHDSLQDDLLNCHVTIAYNSNALVESLIAGVPILVLGPGAVTKGMGADVIEEETVEQPLLLDRTQFFADLAYRQWTLPELAEGYFWKHLIDHDPPTIEQTVPNLEPIRRKRGRPRKTPSQGVLSVESDIPADEIAT